MGKWCKKKLLKQQRILMTNIVLEWVRMEMFIKLSYK